MEKEKLSELYHTATIKIHRLTSELYEDLHTQSGNPNESVEEIDFIRSSIQEYKEQQ